VKVVRISGARPSTSLPCPLRRAHIKLCSAGAAIGHLQRTVRASETVVKMKPRLAFADLIALLALRPGRSAADGGGIRRRQARPEAGDAISSGNEGKSWKGPTASWYKEQVMRILNRSAETRSLAQAYATIKAISKKKAEVGRTERKQFINRRRYSRPGRNRSGPRGS